MDPDGDGRVNTSDADSKHQALDANKDGAITSAEYGIGLALDVLEMGHERRR